MKYPANTEKLPEVAEAEDSGWEGELEEEGELEKPAVATEPTSERRLVLEGVGNDWRLEDRLWLMEDRRVVVDLAHLESVDVSWGPKADDPAAAAEEAERC